MIRVQPFPPSDEHFVASVRTAVRRIAPATLSDFIIEAPSEDALRGALSEIRRRYPDVWISPKDPMASMAPGALTWYVFRDGTPGVPTDRPGPDVRSSRLSAGLTSSGPEPEPVTA